MPDTFEPAPPTAERQAIAAEWKRLQAPRGLAWATRLPYVISVERVLRADFALYPLFTDSKVRLPG